MLCRLGLLDGAVKLGELAPEVVDLRPDGLGLGLGRLPGRPLGAGLLGRRRSRPLCLLRELHRRRTSAVRFVLCRLGLLDGAVKLGELAPEVVDLRPDGLGLCCLDGGAGGEGHSHPLLGTGQAGC
ncbi:hypothetical protein [Streptomyces sp. NRRL WC-3742]|uniref:hypothetical protein n=1 Tax=Streptomyces sp. NRRL WC-3742 TaxID=1463934 RepID=UPI000ADEC8E4|nr:hypothetical protein [Streptomyces sp. NRRL WC-3742]